MENNLENSENSFSQKKADQDAPQNDQERNDEKKDNTDLNRYNSKLSFCPSEILNLQKERTRQRKLSKSLENKDFDNLIFNLGTRKFK